MIAAHDSDADWLMWLHPEKALAIAHHVEQPPELAQPTVFYSWRSSIDHCAHGVILKNCGCTARHMT